MKYFQGPITAAWFPPLIGRQHKNIQKKLKKTLFGWEKTLFGWAKTPFQILFFL
jgi:hypothetical protein